MSLRITAFVALALSLFPLEALGQSVPPAATASPAPVAPTYVRFADAELLPGERVADPASPNRTGSITNSLRADAEFKFLGRNFAEFEYRRWNPDHRYAEQDVIFNSSLYGIGHTYVATSTIVHSDSEGAPTLHADLGIGFERLPDPTKRVSLFGSYYYYPEVTGKLAEIDGSRPNLRYKLQTFRLGGSLALPPERVFLTANLIADHYLRKENATGDATHTSASLGIGYRL